METLPGVLKIVVPVIIMILIGMVCRKRCIIQKQGIAGLKAIIMNICLPVVLFNAFYQASYSLSIVVITIAMFLASLAAFGLGFAFKKAIRAKEKTFPFLMTGFEAGMLGYSLYVLLFGAAAVTNIATVDLGQVLFVFTVYLSILNKGKGGSLKTSLRSMATSPVIISIIAGVAVGVSGLGALAGQSAAGDVIQSVLDFIKAPTAAVILLVVGYEIEFHKANFKLVLAAVFGRLILMCLLGTLVVLVISMLIPVSNDLKWAFVLMFLLPAPYILPVYVESDDESAFISATLSISTVITLIAFTAMAIYLA